MGETRQTENLLHKNRGGFEPRLAHHFSRSAARKRLVHKKNYLSSVGSDRHASQFRDAIAVSHQQRDAAEYVAMFFAPRFLQCAQQNEI